MFVFDKPETFPFTRVQPFLCRDATYSLFRDSGFIRPRKKETKRNIEFIPRIRQTIRVSKRIGLESGHVEGHIKRIFLFFARKSYPFLMLRNSLDRDPSYFSSLRYKVQLIKISNGVLLVSWKREKILFDTPLFRSTFSRKIKMISLRKIFLLPME